MSAFTLTSQKNQTQRTLQDLYELLSDFSNFNSILPEDKVEDFVHSGDSCSFTIKGITPMSIRLTDKKPNEYLHFSSEGLSKFNFHLHVSFFGDAQLPGECQVELKGDLNPFILKMAEKPLQNLVNNMSNKLSLLKPKLHDH